MEVAVGGDGLVRIRDSKDPDGSQIVISADCWRQSLPRLADLPDAAGAGLVAAAEADWMVLRDVRQPEDAVLRFTTTEWDAFLAGARDGEFSLTSDGRLAPAELPPGQLKGLSAAGRGQRHPAPRLALQAALNHFAAIPSASGTVSSRSVTTCHSPVGCQCDGVARRGCRRER